MFCCHVARRSPSHYSLFYLLFRQRRVVFFGEAAVILTNKYKIHDLFSFSPHVCVLIPWQMHQDALHLLQKRAASNLEPLWINEKAEKQTSGKKQQTCEWLINRLCFSEKGFRSVAMTGAWGGGSIRALKSFSVCFSGFTATALILILFNSLCLTFNSLQRLSDWRLSKQSWVHPSLELVFCGTSPSSLWALYQFDQICSITACKHQECFRPVSEHSLVKSANLRTLTTLLETESKAVWRSD